MCMVHGRTQADAAASRQDRSDWWGAVLDAPDARALARFYADLLGWEIAREQPEHCVVAPRDGVAHLGFQTSPGYVPPVWPPAAESQQMMMHLDFEVTDLEAAVAHARELGAQEAEYQPQGNVRVLLDPVGHPFCVYVDE